MDKTQTYLSLNSLPSFGVFLGFCFLFLFFWGFQQCSLYFVYLGLAVMIVAFMGNFQKPFFFIHLIFVLLYQYCMKSISVLSLLKGTIISIPTSFRLVKF